MALTGRPVGKDGGIPARPIGFLVREHYINAGYTRRGFAREIGVSEIVLRWIEKGRPIRPVNAKKIADHMGLKVTDLMPLEDAA